MVASPLASRLHRYPLAGPFLSSLRPPSDYVGLHLAVANLLVELDATVSRSSLAPNSNAVRGLLMNHPEYSLWNVYDAGAYTRECETMAAVVLLLARGQVIPPAQLVELRRGLELGSGGRLEYARISKRFVERAHAATVLLSDTAWDVEADDAQFTDEALTNTTDYRVGGAATQGAARLLAASIHDTFRRNFTQAGACAPVGDRARMMVAELRRRVSGPAPSPAAALLLTSIHLQQPVGAVLRQTELARLDDDCKLQSDGVWRIDLKRGLAAIPIAGVDALWAPDTALADLFPETDGQVVVSFPPYLVQALKHLAAGREVGPVIADSASLRDSVWDLLSELRVLLGGRLLVRRIAGTLGFALFEASQDMAALQRLAGHELNDSLARGSYFCATHAQLQSPLEAALASIGLTDGANPLPPLPPAWAARRAGARRLPQSTQLKELASQFNQKLRAAARSKSEARAEMLTSLLAVHAAALLMLGASHRWTGPIGELTRWDVCPQVGLGIFFDKPVDALHARRLVLLPGIVKQSLQGWLQYCQWLAHHANEAIARRARAALNGSEPLLFLVAGNDVAPVTLAAIGEAVGVVGTAVSRGSRCLISSRLRQEGIAAARIDPQLGHTCYGEASFDPPKSSSGSHGV